MAVSIIGPKFYAWASDTGAPLAFGKVFTYQAGTNTPKATFQSEDGVTENANPVILNGAGYAGIYLIGSYKIVVKDADDVEVWTADPVTSATREEVDNIADLATTYTETEVDGLLDDKSSLQAAGITVTVGTGGDYPTINAALEYLSKLQPVYDSAGITATINLLSGFVMAEQVLVRGLDLGWITITGADAETTITNTALTTNFTTADYGSNSYPAFGVSKGGVLPRIDQLFRIDVADIYSNKQGIMAVGAGSSADVLAGAGVNDAGTHGIIASRGSTINAKGADASGAGAHGIIASGGSSVNAEGADASGAGANGISAVTGSTVNAAGADASGAGYYGIYAVTGSTVNAAGADASGAGSHGIYADDGSTVNANSAGASGAGSHGIYADDGSTINAEGANASSAVTYGIYARRVSTVNANSANASGAGSHGIYAEDGSTINADTADVSGAGNFGIFADDGSTINADTADVSGAVVSPSDTAITGTATFTNSTNNIALTGIGSIGLEVGDVIQVTGTASNNKLFTVEVITDSGNVIVNSAHAGGTTSKSLVNETVSATVTLLSKWVNAPVGLGEGWVSLMAGRAKDIIYTNNTGRSLSVMVSVADVTNDDANITAYVDDLQLSVSEDNPYSDSASASRATVSFLVPNESTYEINFLTDSDTLNTWVELR